MLAQVSSHNLRCFLASINKFNFSHSKNTINLLNNISMYFSLQKTINSNDTQKHQKPSLYNNLNILNTKQAHKYTTRYSITFCQSCIIHQGSQALGQKAQHGYTVKQLAQIRQKILNKYHINGQLIDLSSQLPKQGKGQNQAAVLYLPKIVDHLMEFKGAADQLYEEQQNIEYDAKYYSTKLRKIMDKKSRHNIVFGEQAQSRSQDYTKYTIRSFKSLSKLSRFRNFLWQNFGEKSKNLNAEGNKYPRQDSGIGFHGDNGRKIVIGLNLGKSSVLRYFWRPPNSCEHVFNPIDIHVSHGDVYIMSEKASGDDWRDESIYRLVHAAGSRKHLQQWNKIDQLDY